MERFERTYSTGEFAELIGAGVSTLQKWDRDGVLIAGRTRGGRRYYTSKHLDALMRKGHKVYYGDAVHVDGVEEYDMVSRSCGGLQALLARLVFGAGVVIHEPGETFEGKRAELESLFPVEFVERG